MGRVPGLYPECLTLGHTPKAGDFLKNLASMRERWTVVDIWGSPKERLGVPITLGSHILPTIF